MVGGWFVLCVVALIVSGVSDDVAGAVEGPTALAPALTTAVAQAISSEYLPAEVILFVILLVLASAFFSGSETAFCTISRVRLRTMATDGTFSGRLISRMWSHPGRLLTTILVGNQIVNVLIAVVLGTRVENLLSEVFAFSPAAAYISAVLICTGFIVFFGEISPKVMAIRGGEGFARVAAFPLLAIDKLLTPVRDGLLRLTELLFRVTRFSEVRAAPYITDEEFKSMLSDGEAHGVLQEDEAQMIQGVLEFHDLVLSEILIPRPDVVAVPESATVGEALTTFREHEYSRMPVYREDLDHIVGVMFVKALLPSVEKGELDTPITQFIRPAQFVPETMTVYEFVKETQRLRTHLAIVVDEHGGTEGIVTLDDAIQEVVGDISDEEEDVPAVQKLSESIYLIAGSLPLDEVNKLLGTQLEDEEHETIAGFLMNQSDKIPEVGDTLEHNGARFTVVSVEGKRAALLRIDLAHEGGPEGSAP
jgi:putative hemolysin